MLQSFYVINCNFIISDQCSHFTPPENKREPKVLQGGIEWEHWLAIGQQKECLREVSFDNWTVVLIYLLN